MVLARRLSPCFGLQMDVCTTDLLLQSFVYGIKDHTLRASMQLWVPQKSDQTRTPARTYSSLFTPPPWIYRLFNLAHWSDYLFPPTWIVKWFVTYLVELSFGAVWTKKPSWNDYLQRLKKKSVKKLLNYSSLFLTENCQKVMHYTFQFLLLLFLKVFFKVDVIFTLNSFDLNRL